METRYQVFVSSTYEDLREARQQVIQVLLAMGCLPSSMEVFPAVSDDAWTYIKRIIDDCDYYVLVIGGRYGSVDSSGLSFTEREYEYAIAKGKEVICFIHEHPEALPLGRSERSDEAQAKLDAFKNKARSRLFTRPWNEPADLAVKVATGISGLMQEKPGIGWVRGDRARSQEDVDRLASLSRRVAELEVEVEAARLLTPFGADGLAHGGEEFLLHFDYYFVDESSQRRIRLAASASPTWDEIFASVGPTLAGEASSEKLLARLAALCDRRVEASGRAPTGTHISSSVSPDDYDTILVQLQALGLVSRSGRRRSVRDTEPYWTLTDYGHAQMLRTRAIRAGRAEASSPGAEAKPNG